MCSQNDDPSALAASATDEPTGFSIGPDGTPYWSEMPASATDDPGLADIAGHSCPQCRRVASRAASATDEGQPEHPRSARERYARPAAPVALMTDPLRAALTPDELAAIRERHAKALVVAGNPTPLTRDYDIGSLLAHIAALAASATDEGPPPGVNRARWLLGIEDARPAAPVALDDLDWLMTLIIARASNAEYHRAKDILLRLGARHPKGVNASNADAALSGEPTDD